MSHPATFRTDRPSSIPAATGGASSSVPAGGGQQPATSPHAPRRGWLRRTVPKAAVLTALVALAVWGHRHQWKFPTAVTDASPEANANLLWCEEHGVAEEHCIECQRQLAPLPLDVGWCQQHGVPQCVLEHPELAQTPTPPTVYSEVVARAGAALDLLPRPENHVGCTLHQRRIQFGSPEAIDRAGVDVDVAERWPVVEAISANAELEYDPTRSAHLSSRVAGTVWRVFKQVGDVVKEGDVLALVDAAKVGEAKSQLLQSLSAFRLAEATVERLRPLAEDEIVPRRRLLEAERAEQEARIHLLAAEQALANLGLPVDAAEFADASIDYVAKRLQTLGLPSDVLQAGATGTPSSNLVPIRAPLAGTVVEQHAVAGEVVEAGATLFSVADVRRMWLLLSVRQEDAPLTRLGQTVRFRAGGAGGTPHEGRLDWISTAADPQTRAVRMRAELDNADGRLRANTFGTAQIVLREEPQAIVVPSEAIHWEGCCNVVFVRDKDYWKPDSPKFFHVRKVRPGVKSHDKTEIIVGLLPGEVIATTGSNVLAAQLMKSKLGDGCGHGHAH